MKIAVSEFKARCTRILRELGTTREPVEITSRGVAIASTQLPGEFHRDPAAQIIVATARCHDATLITADRAIQEYAHVRTRWA